MCSDIISSIKANCDDLPYRPTTVFMHTLDALRFGFIKRLPRKDKKRLKKERKQQAECKKYRGLFS
jgi:hypothetical protein